MKGIGRHNSRKNGERNRLAEVPRLWLTVAAGLGKIKGLDPILKDGNLNNLHFEMHALPIRFPKLYICPLLLSLALPGCGTGAYKDRAAADPLPPGALAVDGRVGSAATLTHLRRETPFRKLYEQPINDFPKTEAKGLSLRIPRLFKQGGANALNPIPADPLNAKDPGLTPEPMRPNDDVVNLFRVRPHYVKSLFQAPHHLRTYEGFVRVPGRESPDQRLDKPYYLYIATIPAKGKDGKSLSPEQLQKQIRDMLVNQFGEKMVTKWEAVDLPTPEGQSHSWNRIKATGEQWYFLYEGSTPVKKFPVGANEGVFLVYLRTAQEPYVVLGWRATSDVVGAIDLETLAAACAGTVKTGG